VLPDARRIIDDAEQNVGTRQPAGADQPGLWVRRGNLCSGHTRSG
jgi:hypothetical protein